MVRKGLRAEDERDIEVLSYELKKVDTTKIKPLYKQLYRFLEEEGYKSLDGDSKPEDLYFEKMRPGGKREFNFWWRLKRDINKYIRYFLRLDWQGINLTQQKVKYKGKPIKADNGDLIIRAQLLLQFDIDGKWRKNWFTKKIEPYFLNNIYRKEIEKHKDQIYSFGMRMQTFIKRYLEMTSFEERTGEDVKRFHPKRGYKKKETRRAGEPEGK